jgi:N utilization substance protein B
MADVKEAPGGRHQGRVLAFQVLFAWDISGVDPAEDLFSFSWAEDPRRPPLPESVKDFARLLASGTIAHVSEIDAALDACLEHWDLDRVSKVELAVLRLSAFCLLHQKDVDKAVVIDEAIEITKAFTMEDSDSYKFVNGVLDAVVKRGI